uniref:acylphosphatase n=1 Tax=Eubacterium cellulosolvens TaxID=29322 RepID=UPI00192E6747|nr:acylphosphatase [[Eubacterium] cellulosolvens]
MALHIGEQKMIRQRLVFTGRVQGVGFRYRAKYLADDLGITGWVMNESDGSVVMEAQGTHEQLYRLIQGVNKGHWVSVEHIDRTNLPVEEHEYYFDIKGY